MLKSITPTVGQRDQVGNFASAAAKKAVDKLELDGEAVQLVIMRGDQFAAGVEELIRRLSLGTQSHDRAKAIMGRNFFGVEEATQHFGVKPAETELAALATIPYSEMTLEACKNTHVLVAVFPLSVVVCKNPRKKVFYNQDWYNREQFATQVGTVGWKLVRKAPVEGSTFKTWDEQQKLLGKSDETLTAQVIVYTMVGHFLAIGERLFEKIWVRCSDVDSNGYRVDVGLFDSDGLHVGACWAAGRDGNVGVASARKFDN